MNKDRQRRRVLAGPQSQLRHLDIPVAELSPEEIVYLPLGLSELELLHVALDARRHPVQPADYPPVLPVVSGGRLPSLRRRRFVDDCEHVPGGVPHLVHEVPACSQLACVDAHVVAGGVARDEGEAKGVGAVFFHGIDGVRDVASGLAHLGPLLVPDEAMKVHVLKGYVTRVLQPHHNHPGHPEKEDVVAGFHHSCGMEIPEILGVVRPAKC